MCNYDIPWCGKCKEKPVDGKQYCKEHLDVKCGVCHTRQATRGCSVAGSFVCGFPICDSMACIDKHYKNHY